MLTTERSNSLLLLILYSTRLDVAVHLRRCSQTICQNAAKSISPRVLPLWGSGCSTLSPRRAEEIFSRKNVEAGQGLA